MMHVLGWTDGISYVQMSPPLGTRKLELVPASSPKHLESRGKRNESGKSQLFNMHT